MNFATVKTTFMGTDVSDIREHLAYQFNVTGEASGIFYVEVKDGQLHIEPYEYYDRDAIFTGTAEVFTAIMTGKKDPVAVAVLILHLQWWIYLRNMILTSYRATE